MTKKEYDIISANWKGKVYERWDRMEPRLEVFKDFVGMLKGKDVLEIGCNAGVYAYEMKDYVNSYVGIEPTPLFYNQLMETAIHLPGDKMQFVNNDVKGYVGKLSDCKFNAFVSHNVLYHLSDKSLEILKAKIFPYCDVIITSIRSCAKKMKRNTYKLYTIDNVLKYLGYPKFNKITTYDIISIIGSKNDNKRDFH